MTNHLFQFLETALLLPNIILVAMAGYLLMLTVAAFYARNRQPVTEGHQRKRFLILIPAHNEEQLLPQLLDSLAQLDYPRDRFAVHIVVDNCSDATAAVARQHGAHVYERFNTEHLGKGFALNWLLAQLKKTNVAGDAYLILDADSIVSPGFLRVMDARLERGERVVQAYYSVREPERSFSVALRYAALAVLHYLRPLGRTILGGSAGLKGNGMVFSSEILEASNWSSDLTEDIQFHMELILKNQRVTFAPDARVWAEMPASLEKSETQNARWETGRFDMARRYAPQLLGLAAAAAGRGRWTRAFMFFDAAMEHMILPFSLLIVASTLSFIASVMMLAALIVFKDLGFIAQTGFLLENIAGLNVLLGITVLAAQIIYLMAGLYLDRAPGYVYRSLLYAPVYMVWKIRQVAGILLRKQERTWVRTSRNKV